MIIISPMKGIGNCGYHVVLISLLYHALKATKDPSIKNEINSSVILKEILANMAKSNKDISLEQSNVDVLLSQMKSNTIIIGGETFSSFTNAIKQSCLKSEWLKSYIEEILLTGLWYSTNYYANSSKIKTLSENISGTIQKQRYLFTSEWNSEDSDLIIVQNYMSLLDKNTLQELIKNIIDEVYDTTAAWFDLEYLKNIDKMLFPNSDLLFSGPHLRILNEDNSDHFKLCMNKSDDEMDKLQKIMPSYIDVSSISKPLRF